MSEPNLSQKEVVDAWQSVLHDVELPPLAAMMVPHLGLGPEFETTVSA